MAHALLFLLGLAAGTLAGVIGTGGSLILLPILVLLHGPRAAVPIMAIASVLANLGRIGAWFHDVDWRRFGPYSLAAAPAAALGARTLLAIPVAAADLTLSLFFVFLLILRHRTNHDVVLQPTVPTLLAAGGGVGFLTGVVQSTGPLSLAVFAAFGLRQGPLLGTEAAASLAIYLAKTITFSAVGAIDKPLLLQGLFVGSSLIAGAFLGKGIVRRMGRRQYDQALDLTIGVNAIIMLAAAVREMVA